MKILVAVEKNKLNNKLMYSFNNGDNWMDYYFSNSSVVVNELIVDQRTNSAAFYLVSKKLNNQNVIFIVDFKADNKATPSFTILKTTNKKICNHTEFKFDLVDQISYPDNSLELKYSLVLDSMFNFNYLEVKIYSVQSDNKLRLGEKSEKELNDLLKLEQKILTDKMSFFVYNLYPETEYYFYFYANVTNQDQAILKKFDYEFVYTTKNNISRLHLAIIGLSITVFLIVSFYVWLSCRKNFEKILKKLFEKMRIKMNNSSADEINYISETQSEDNKFLIEKSSATDNKVENLV